MAPEPRIASLDAFRGFAIAAMVLVNNPGDWSNLHAPLAHAPWHGWTFTDTVFPFFLFAAGLAMPMSLGRRAAKGADRADLLAATARRAAVLFAVGLALNFIPAFDPATVRIPGVLQRIALCVLVAAPVVIWGGTRATLAAIAACFALYGAPMLLATVPDAWGHAARGVLEPGRDFGSFVDRALFGPHLWSRSRTWDPEGLVSTLPAVASLLFGVLASRSLVLRLGRGRKAGALAIAGGFLVIAGYALDAAFMPINKNLWTPSYAVFMAGWALATFAAFHALLDESTGEFRRRARALALPLTMFGMNALFLFAFSGLVARILGAVRLEDGVTPKAALFALFKALPLSPANASLAYAVAFTLAMLAVAAVLWRMRWFIKA